MGQIANKLLRLNTEKHRIREAIGRKGVELTPATPLAQYAPAIDSIDTGQVLPFAPANDYFRVIFIDYDGGVLKDVLVRRGNAVAPPTVPTHPHLSFHGWNREAAKLASVQCDMCVGATYDVEDDAIWMNVSTDAIGTIKIALDNSQPEAERYVDWGDGEVTTVTSSMSDVSHAYAETYNGWIKFGKAVKLNFPRSSDFLPAGIEEVLLGHKSVVKTNQATFYAVCLGYGVSMDTVTISSFMGFVDWGSPSTASITTNFNFSDAFNLSTGVRNISFSGSYGVPPMLIYEARVNDTVPASKIQSVSYDEQHTSTVSNSSTGPTRVIFVGRTFAPLNFLGAGAKVSIFIEEGAVPTGNCQFSAMYVTNLMEILEALGEATQAITITIRCNVLRQQYLSDMLTAKGYTVAFN